MKAFLEIELFGEDFRQINKLYRNAVNEMLPGLGDITFGNVPSSGWVAEINGFDPKYKYMRRFLRCKKDYSRANSKGSRGIYAEYILESGKIYEVKSQISWSKTNRYFCTVNEEGNIVILEETEVQECLRNHLESMSSQLPDNE